MKTLVELKNVDWKDVKERLNIEDSLRYHRVLLNPKPDCPDCNGTGISKYTYDCGALNCSGHNDIICNCREFQFDCPYKDEHPNVSGNWTTFYTDGEISVKCWNVEAHSKNPAAKAGDRNGTRVRNVVFLIHNFKPTPNHIREKQEKNDCDGDYDVVWNRVLNGYTIEPEADLRFADFSGVDLTGEDLSGLNLELSDFSKAILKDVDFTNSILYGASFESAILTGAKFRHSDVKEANFSFANLVGADFTGAKLESASFESANLTKANFTNADLYKTDLSFSDLTDAILHTSLKTTDLTGVKGL